MLGTEQLTFGPLRIPCLDLQGGHGITSAKAPTIEKQLIPIDRLKSSIHALEIFNPGLKVSISLGVFNLTCNVTPDLDNSPQKGALKYSISLVMFNLA